MTWTHGKVPPVRASTIPEPINSKQSAQKAASKLSTAKTAPTSAPPVKGANKKIHRRSSDLSASQLHPDMRKKLSQDAGQ